MSYSEYKTTTYVESGTKGKLIKVITVEQEPNLVIGRRLAKKHIAFDDLNEHLKENEPQNEIVG